METHSRPAIPQLGRFLDRTEFITLNRQTLTFLARQLFEEIRHGKIDIENGTDESVLVQIVLSRLDALCHDSLIPLINATGIVLHTNLGRSPIEKSILDEMQESIGSYCNLEFDIDSGKRGERYGHLTKKLSFLLGCEDAIVVNNNAAAVFLILNTFAKGKETIVSRGELVEIGGSFRIPDVMRESGTLLKEIGTTNKTKASDYTAAITPQSAIMMKVHRSNFSVVGFTHEVAFEELIPIAQSHNVIDYYDAGSLNLFEAPYLGNEVCAKSLFEHAPSLVSFSGDKLLGSVQAGIIAGKKELIDTIKKNQLLRMLRVDKLTMAVLEKTLTRYIQKGPQAIKTHKLLSKTLSEMQIQSDAILSGIEHPHKLSIGKTSTYAGGGSLPQHLLESLALIIEDHPKNAERLIKALRDQGLIARIEKDKVLLDLRSIDDDELSHVMTILNTVLKERP
ncbi:MAG: L-seryl-tRNA(Sec) selenium transferase [Sulfuricurvum sp.]|uniref:L-seryl-tRNA(Sec) selenium transferase n=1 Tax=Sulfuricurvum sp. TaxID=2025608 RepID=UPI0027239847|nr:L-seryl-tRNA(Sec) selenium transferase [Sulfuricurvum sp.]MDO9057040.1 L-seryl-tRNA(Sec) selenium transferase [Sulfuricurvum sp.]